MAGRKTVPDKRSIDKIIMKKQQPISSCAFIGLLMDASDSVEKVRREFDGIVAARRPLSSEEFEAIKALMIGIEKDISCADSIRFENYEKVSKLHFAIPYEQMGEDQRGVC